MTDRVNMKGITVKINDNSPEVLEALKNAIERSLEAMGETAERHAKKNITKQKAVDTGNLRNSTSYNVDDDSVYIGTVVKYAPYVELGTGIYYPGGRTEPWVYQDAKGKWHMTHGQKARPFIKPAVAEHVSEYRNIIKESLENA